MKKDIIIGAIIITDLFWFFCYYIVGLLQRTIETSSDTDVSFTSFLISTVIMDAVILCVILIVWEVRKKHKK